MSSADGAGRSAESINALFSGLAFVVLVAAIFFQREELRLQRRELEQTRPVLDDQRKQLEAQDQTMQKQVFETTFFALVRQFREIADSLAPLSGSTVLAGTSTWEDFRDRVIGTNFSGLTAERQRTAYTGFYRGEGAGMATYFTILTETLEFLLQSRFVGEVIYARILRATISPTELFFIALHGVTPEGQRLKQLIERFALLRHVREGQGYPSLHILAEYADSAREDHTVALTGEGMTAHAQHLPGQS